MEVRLAVGARNLILPTWILFALTLIGCGAQSTPPADLTPTAPATPTASPTSTTPAATTGTTPATSAAPPVAEIDADPPAEPATAAEAKASFDLAAFPIYPDAEAPRDRRLGELVYTTKGTVEKVFEFQREKLRALGFEELEGTSVTPESANGVFAHNGYRVSLSVSSYGATAEQPRDVSVYIFNHGNVNPSQLPVPQDAKISYSGPSSAMFISEKPAAETAKEVKKLFTDQGWVPFGTAGDTQYFRKNAICVLATVSEAPAQGGKTMISYSANQLSVELPPPAEMIDGRYTDSDKTLAFDTTQSEADLQKYYRETLGALGWTATTEEPLEIDWKKLLIFRNEAKDLLELETSTVDGKTRAELRHQSAAEVAEIDRLVKEEVARRKREMEEEAARPKPKFAITIPSGAEDVEVDTNEIAFKVGSGKAVEAFDALRKQLTDAGWEEEQHTQSANLGHSSFKKGDHSITLTYVETGILPSELTITGFGIELEQAE
jgi:hypothetical protein